MEDTRLFDDGDHDHHAHHQKDDIKVHVGQRLFKVKNEQFGIDRPAHKAHTQHQRRAQQGGRCLVQTFQGDEPQHEGKGEGRYPEAGRDEPFKFDVFQPDCLPSIQLCHLIRVQGQFDRLEMGTKGLDYDCGKGNRRHVQQIAAIGLACDLG